MGSRGQVRASHEDLTATQSNLYLFSGCRVFEQGAVFEQGETTVRSVLQKGP